MDTRQHMLEGQAIPALPLALQQNRHWDERRQAALVRYYVDSGAGGLAVGVHSTQFSIREKNVGLFEPVLRLAAETASEWLGPEPRSFALIAGICGKTRQALSEARTALELGYHIGLLSLAAWKTEREEEILAHCATVAQEIPVIGFYLQTSVGGRVFSFDFWGKFAEIPQLVGVKVAPFNRYRTIDVVRATMEAERTDVALYTGNDDHIIADLLTPFHFAGATRHIDGGLLGQWGVGTRQAVRLLGDLKKARKSDRIDKSWLQKDAELTDMNAAIFDAANNFAGCLPGIHEVLRRQGLLNSIVCLDREETLSAGQAEEISRVCNSYPWLIDDAFVSENLSRWLG